MHKISSFKVAVLLLYKNMFVSFYFMTLQKLKKCVFMAFRGWRKKMHKSQKCLIFFLFLHQQYASDTNDFKQQWPHPQPRPTKSTWYMPLLRQITQWFTIFYVQEAVCIYHLFYWHYIYFYRYQRKPQCTKNWQLYV